MKYLNRRDCFLLLLIAILFLALFAANSGFGFSHDYYNYLDIYQEAARGGVYRIDSNVDVMFYKAAAVIGGLGLPFSIFTFLYVLLSITIKFSIICIRFYKNNVIWIFLLFYMTQLYWLHDYTQIRMSLALAFAMWGIYGKSQKLKFLAFLLAILSHVSAAIIPLAYYVSYRISIGKLLILAVSMILVCILVYPYLVDFILSEIDIVSIPFLNKISDYALLNSGNDQLQLNIFSPTPALQLFIVLILAPHIISEIPDAKVEIVLSIVGPLFFYCLSPIPIVATRFYEMFIIFFLVLIGRSWIFMGWLRLLMVPYIFLSLRAAFFSSDPIVYLFVPGA